MSLTQITTPSSLSVLPQIFDFCANFASAEAVPEDKRFALEVCVEEIVTNIIKYGYPEGSEGPITINLERSGDRLSIRIEDEGVPFDPTQTEEVDIAQSLEDRPIGGLGIHMVKKMMAEIHYQRVDQRNQLTMIANLA